MALGLVGFDRRALGGAACLVGIDEVGRGCLAGPVVAAAIRCEADFYSSSWCRRHSRQVDDSKRLRAVQRAEVVRRFTHAFRKKWIRIGYGSASVEEIGRLNIYHATTLAMKRALAGVLELQREDLWSSGGGGLRPEIPILIDGRPIRHFPHAHEGIVKGDQRSLAIALAGIHAKEWRDRYMRDLDREVPGYGFAAHKGYGTAGHVEALQRKGPTRHHRPGFLKNVGGSIIAGASASQGSLFPAEAIQSES
ncbi:MAG: ribonuclease HII [Oceanipulchritudo sp.]